MISLTLQCATQWEALAHIFYDNKMWNGYSAALVDSDGAQKNGIEKVRAEMAGRGVLLDVARWAGVDYFEDGTAITNDDLNEWYNMRDNRVANLTVSKEAENMPTY